MDKLLELLRSFNTDSIYLFGESVIDIRKLGAIVNYKIATKFDIKSIFSEISQKFDMEYYNIKDNYIYIVINDRMVIEIFGLKEDLSFEEFLMSRELNIERIGMDLDMNILYNFAENGINSKIIEVVRNCCVENPLRTLFNIVRMMSKYSFKISNNTVLYLSNEKFDNTVDSYETRNLLFTVLSNKNSYLFFKYLDNFNVIDKIFPEVYEMKEVGECKYHVVDTWTHSLYTLEVLEEIIYSNGYFEDHVKKSYENHTSREYENGIIHIEMLKLAAFFHDVGKPSAMWIDNTGRVRFKGHEITGEEIVGDIGERVRLTDNQIGYLKRMVREHMRPLVLYKSNNLSKNSLNELFSLFKEEVHDILLIGLADIIATRRLLDPSEEMGIYKIYIEYMMNNYLVRYKPLYEIRNMNKLKQMKSDFPDDYERLLDTLVSEIYLGNVKQTEEGITAFIENI
jgi:poly(A) polymerase